MQAAAAPTDGRFENARTVFAGLQGPGLKFHSFMGVYVIYAEGIFRVLRVRFGGLGLRHLGFWRSSVEELGASRV